MSNSRQSVRRRANQSAPKRCATWKRIRPNFWRCRGYKEEVTGNNDLQKLKQYYHSLLRQHQLIENQGAVSLAVLQVLIDELQRAESDFPGLFPYFDPQKHHMHSGLYSRPGIQAYLSTVLARLEVEIDEPERAPVTPSGAPDTRPIPQYVFIVHGRNETVLDKIDLYLTKDLKLQTHVMQAGPHAGRTLPEKFEEMAKVCKFAIFILTADDILIDKSSNKNIKRARQNVILEIGYFWGSLGRRGNVAFLGEADPEMELPSDIQGMGLIPITSDLAETKIQLRRELKEAGLVS
jgi:predicted nucleotide-binding protein